MEGVINHRTWRAICLTHTHTHTHGVCMYGQGEALIIGLEELPGAAYDPLIENLTHTYTSTESVCSTGQKISYFTMILQSAQNSEMRFVYSSGSSSTRQCLFAVHQLSCGLFAHHTMYSTNVSKQSKHLQDSALLSFGGCKTLSVQHFNAWNNGASVALSQFLSFANISK